MGILRTLLWIPTLGHSIRWFHQFPHVEITSFVSSVEPPLVFYRRWDYLHITFGGYDRADILITIPNEWKWVEEDGRLVNRLK